MTSTKKQKPSCTSTNEEITCMKTWHCMLILGITQIIFGFCLPIMLWQFNDIVENYGLDLGFWTGLAFIIFGLAGVIFVGSNIPSKYVVITHLILPIVTSVFICIILTLTQIAYNKRNLRLFDGNGSIGMRNQIVFIYCIILVIGFIVGFWSKIPSDPDSEKKKDKNSSNSSLNGSEQTTLEIIVQ